MKNLAIVKDALRMLTVLDADQEPSAEDGQLGLDQLNDLFAIMVPDGIDLGYPPQESLSDDFPLDDTTAAQIKPLLAVKLHAFYPSAVLSPGVAALASTAMAQITRTAVLYNMEEADMSNIPLGEGTRSGVSILSGE